MFAVIWVTKVSLNPWTRKEYHLLHHRRSGQIDDVEERLLGLGIGNVFVRLLVAFYPPLAVTWIRDIHRDTAKYQVLRGSCCSLKRWIQRMDLVFINSPLIVSLAYYFGVPGTGPALVCWILPNVLRHACIALLSSYSHYYGDITPGDVTQQNQILRHPLLWPMQLFCCNFGAEHIIHHFVVGQPFYIRHWVRKEAWKSLEAAGIRVNDWAIVARANRWGAWPSTTTTTNTKDAVEGKKAQ